MIPWQAYDALTSYAGGDVVTHTDRLWVCLMAPGGVVDGVEPGSDPSVWAPIIAADASAPATRDYVRARWADARDIADDVLDALLVASWSRCVPFVPADQSAAYDAGTLPGGVLMRWRDANTLDARDLWRASSRDGDVVGFDAYAIRVRPLSDAVRSLLRPARGVPLVG